MDASEVERATYAATEVASALGLPVGETRVVCGSNKLALRLLPCDVFARVAFVGQEAFCFEIEIARRLAESRSPVAALDARVEPRVYERDGFAVTLWRYYEQSSVEAPADAYAKALERLHAGMAQLDIAAPHFSDRVAEAQQLVASPERTPRLEAADRELLSRTLQSCSRRIDERAAPEQLLHGEPHPGNVLTTAEGLVFIDLETCCRGPVEFDLAHAPEAVSEAYPGADRELVHECRRLVLAMIAAWRSDADDRFPDGERAGRALLRALRAGPPWPTAAGNT
ncbi:MAG TPA: phosphotransferase [Gaiellaceae bacterium]|nr:phosphotransferase [Gaiellaceae bacterium]